jgi:hypothetical protein
MASREARNDDQRAAIRAILSALPKNHPARAACEAGAGAIELMSLVDREDVAEELNQAWLDWYSRRLHQQHKLKSA